MRAVVYERYGTPEVLGVREVDPPVVGERDVLVRVHAAGVGAGDWHLLTGVIWAVRLYQGLFRPKRPILGHDFSGVVEAVGAAVARFRPGDEVYGSSPGAGAFAELVSAPEDGLAAKPANLTHEAAAAVPSSAVTALQGLRDKGKIRAGCRVLINGASGGVGTFAVQIARTYDAHVTGVCGAAKRELVESLGAESVVDYRGVDYTATGERYDLILDLAGKQPVAACRHALAPEGIYVAAAGAPSRTLRVALTGGKRMVAMIARTTAADLEHLNGLLENGSVRPVLGGRYGLDEVPEALRRLGAGSVQGKLVIAVRATG